MSKLVLCGQDLSPEEIIEFGEKPWIKVELCPQVIERMRRGREILESKLGETIYGVNTGFGELASVKISPQDIEKLQENLIKSHHAGAGECIPPEIARAAVLIRLHTLSTGFSGIRPELALAVADYLNCGLAPCMKEYGSVGASGDLAPLASFALSLSFPHLTEAFLWKNGWRRLNAGEAARRAGFKPISLKAKEALSLINGTPFSSALALFALKKGKFLLLLSDLAQAMSMEALGSPSAFLFRGIHRLRKIPSQTQRAENVARMIQGSSLVGTSEEVQPPYSIRCYPQVAGASGEALRFAEELLTGEVNSVTDNPLVFEEGVFSGGNFHAQPVALASDNISMALTYLSSISERRLFRLLDGKLNNGLPPFLSKNPGLNSGFMIVQYTAASLVSENKALSHPASVDSIPTSANQEDHVSMAPLGARRALKIGENTHYVLSGEIMAAAQGIELRISLRGGHPGKVTGKALKTLREAVPFVEEDLPLSPLLEELKEKLNEEFMERVLEG